MRTANSLLSQFASAMKKKLCLNAIGEQYCILRRTARKRCNPLESNMAKQFLITILLYMCNHAFGN